MALSDASSRQRKEENTSKRRRSDTSYRRKVIQVAYMTLLQCIMHFNCEYSPEYFQTGLEMLRMLGKVGSTKVLRGTDIIMFAKEEIRLDHQ